MRNFIPPLILLALPLLARSENISVEQAKHVAINFYYERSIIMNSVDFDAIHVSDIRSEGKPVIAYYICEMNPQGFVVISADDKVLPVLAYSFESNYAEDEALPEGFRVWMNHYQQQIDFAVQNNIAPSSEIITEWERLLNANFQVNKSFAQLQEVEPLLVSKWNQDTPYNNWCPPDPAGPGGRCYAGCVATAMGQLLYYYRFPQQGQGSYSYMHPQYGTISADFGATTYYWEGMPSVINKDNDPIGELLFHQGVSVDMDYGPDGSGMWNHKAAYSLKTYFRYGPETQYYFRDSVSIDWDSLLITNLNQRKPLYYAGWAGVQSTSGHAFVCDGYQSGNYYHFNWGWGGSQDGYFYTDNLTPGGSNFNFAQEVIPLFPDTLQNTYPSYCQGNITLTGLKGSVEDGSGWFNYQNNASCSWLISPQDIDYDSITSIKITFLRLKTEAGADTLYVYDGADNSAPLIGAYSGNIQPGVITSTGNKVFIEFHTNTSIVDEGWQLDYESVFPVYCSGVTTLSEPTGSIEDGSGSKKYNTNSMCRWRILNPDGMPVTFIFTSFETYDSSDVVKMIDSQSQQVLGIFSGNTLPPPVTANSGKMMIIFMTNNSGNAQGWSGDYYSSQVGVAENNACLYETLVYPNPTDGLLTIEKYFTQNCEINIQVSDLKGETVFYKKFIVTEGINKIRLNLKQLSKSSYFLIISDGEQKEIKKMVIK